MKADSNPALDALMAAPAIRQSRCGVCGMPSEANHHEPPKGLGGGRSHDHTISLCGRGSEGRTCHALSHKNGGSIRYRQAGDILYFKADEEAALHINKRRKKSGLSRITAGAEYPYTIFPDDLYADSDDSAGNATELHELDRAWAAAQRVSNAVFDLDTYWQKTETAVADLAWTKACIFAQYIEHFGSGKVGHANLVRHMKDNLRVARSEVTRLDHWVALAAIPLADRLGSSTKADLAWKVIERGEEEPGDVVAFCAANSVSAIKEEHFAAGERTALTVSEAHDGLCSWLAARPGQQIPPRTQAEWRAFARGELDG